MKLLLAHVLLGMLGRDHSIHLLAQDDWKTTKQIPKPAFGPDFAENARFRVRVLRKNLLWPLASMFSAAVVAWIAKTQFALFHLTGPQLNSSSAFLAAWAGLARLGWQGQSNSGKTSVERADAYIFHALVWLALNMGIAGNI